jgi:hypothetical protein
MGRSDHKLQMNQLALRNNQFEFKTSGKSPTHCRGILWNNKIPLFMKRKTERCSHVTGWYGKY